MKVFIVTTAVREGRGSKRVTLGAYSDREQAEQIAHASLTQPGGVLCEWITWRTENGYEQEEPTIVKRTEGAITEWGKWDEGADWHTGTSFYMAARVEEVELF